MGRARRGRIFGRAASPAATVVAAAALAAAALAATALPGAGPAAARVIVVPQPPGPHHAPVDANTYPWSSIGKIFNSVGGACTGFAIARDTVMTAAHCLYAFKTRHFLPPDAIHVLFGYERGSYRIHARVAAYRIGPGYDPAGAIKAAPSDWAVLTLIEPLPPAIRPLAPGPAPDGALPLQLGGFPIDRAYLMTADTECHRTNPAGTGPLLLHDCVSAPGDSGAPILARSPTDPNGVTFVAVTIGGTQVKGRPLGLATRADSIDIGRAEPAPR